jgi:MYXO-CTERM domain-containing protein
MLGTALAAALFLTQAGGAAAQNTTEPAPSPPSPAATPTPPPAPTPAPAPPPPASPEPRSDAPPAVVVVPQAQTAPPPIAIESEPYPNGFADPTAPYGNDMSVAVRQESDGFDWGLLGLLGLFGLFGLYRRRDGYRNVVHSERYEDGRPPIRPDR